MPSTRAETFLLTAEPDFPAALDKILLVYWHLVEVNDMSWINGIA